jgi:TPR repeat protein
MLSWMLLEGEVMTPDYIEARHWAELAAAKNIASSMTRLGMIYHNALGAGRDPAQAAAWWQRAAALGDADGQAMLGAAYHLGAGVARDPNKALSLLLTAQTNGSALADRFIAAARGALPDDQANEIERATRRKNAEPVA